MVVAGADALGFGPGPIAMDIPDGYSDIPAGKIATVVTHLQLCQRPSLRPEHPQDSWILRKTNWPDLDQYRALFRRIGEDLVLVLTPAVERRRTTRALQRSALRGVRVRGGGARGRNRGTRLWCRG